jgi:hypothetical protein
MFEDGLREEHTAYYYAFSIMFISLICITICGLSGVDESKITDTFTMYYLLISTANAVMCVVIGSPMIRFIVTFLMTFVLPLIRLMGGKTTLIGGDVACVVVIAVNFFFLLDCIARWRENTVDEVMKKLNGSDPYFANIKTKILKRCGDNTLEWGVENLSIVKLFKLARKGRILDKEDKKEKEKEERMRTNYEEKNENRKRRFLNMIDI